MNDPMIERADRYAAEAHGRLNQRRKYTGEPYIEHPRAVARLVGEAGGDAEMIAAALLHDVVEDTEVTAGDIQRDFGARVGSLVAALTDDPAGVGLNRAARKARTFDRLRAAGGDAQTIKLADLICNTSSIVQHDPDFARLYLREKQVLLAALADGHKGLMARATEMVAQGLDVLPDPPRIRGGAMMGPR